jgi:hypothetical protein
MQMFAGQRARSRPCFLGKSLVNPLTYWTLSNLYHELKNQITSTLNFQNSLIYPLGWFWRAGLATVDWFWPRWTWGALPAW